MEHKKVAKNNSMGGIKIYISTVTSLEDNVKVQIIRYIQYIIYRINMCTFIIRAIMFG